MRGNGIRAECVQHEQIERFTVGPYQLQASVADDHIAIRAASSEKRKIPAGDRLDRSIYLIERSGTAGAPARRHRAPAQAGPTQTLLPPAFAAHLHHACPPP